MMNYPKFLFQSGLVMSNEKFACTCTDYPYIHTSYEYLEHLNVDEYKTNYVPVGSVEFVRKYSDCMGLKLPESISYYGIENFIKRNIREGKLKDADSSEFVKPKKIKQFTGDFKKYLRPLSPETEVWISEPVPFESEFRVYVQDFVSGPQILGWARYDDKDSYNPDPDLNYVKSIAQELHDNLGPGAYSIDIGWRSDLKAYDVVELNDAWALGLYTNTDPQTNSPSKQDYADMLISRWRQILFWNII